MITLNLETKNKEQERIKEYLENNVSEILANKINNGTTIIKDNKTLLNKKDLNDFWQFAYEEARKLRTNNEQVLAIDDNTVFGWAIHYFEEDTLEGHLYNEDGTEYEKQKPKIEYKPTEIKPTIKQPENTQPTLFDLLNTNEEQKQIETDEDEEKEIEEIVDEYLEEQKDIEEIKQEVIQVNNQTIDLETGEVLEQDEILKSIVKEDMFKLYNLLDGKLEIQ